MVVKAKKKTIIQQIKEALDGRTQRWLSEKTAIPEDKLSNKMTGRTKFSKKDLGIINEVLNISLTHE
jgi:hypothetical protein